MRRERRRSCVRGWVSVLLAAFVVGCTPAPTPPPPPRPTPEPTPLPPEPVADVWDAPRAVLAEAGYQIAETDSEQGHLVATRRTVTKTPAERRAAAAELRRISYIEETHLLEGDRRLEEYTLTVQVRLGRAESEVSVSAKAGIVVAVRTGADKKLVSRPIPSRGVLEKELIEKVQQSFEEPSRAPAVAP